MTDGKRGYLKPGTRGYEKAESRGRSGIWGRDQLRKGPANRVLKGSHSPSVNSHCSFPRERSGTTSRSSIGSVRRAGRPPCSSADRTRPGETTQMLTRRSRQPADVRLSTPFRTAAEAPTQQHTSPPFTSRAAAAAGPAIAAGATGATAAKVACRAVKRGRGGAQPRGRSLRRSHARANSVVEV